MSADTVLRLPNTDLVPKMNGSLNGELNNRTTNYLVCVVCFTALMLAYMTCLKIQGYFGSYILTFLIKIWKSAYTLRHRPTLSPLSVPMRYDTSLITVQWEHNFG